MRKAFTCSLMLAAALGLAACDKKSEDKAQAAQAHSEQAKDKLQEAHDDANDAVKHNAEATKAQAESKEAAAEENQVGVPAQPSPEHIENAPKN